MLEAIQGFTKAIPYIRKFKGETFVIKLGGSLIDDQMLLNTIAADIAALHQVGIHIILVHGGGKQATELSKRLGHTPTIINGRRVTSDEDLEIVKMVFAGKINTDLISLLRKHGVQAVGISGIDGGLIYAAKRPVQKVENIETGDVTEVDYGHVGDVQQVDTQLLQVLLANDYVPVISSLAADDQGKIYNINADTIAAEIAVQLKACKLISLTDCNGVLRNVHDENSVISVIDTTDFHQLVKDGVITQGMHPKLVTLLHAVEHGVRRAQIINGCKQHALLFEIFTEEGIGTMMVTSQEKMSYAERGL
ncbi:acetylglutamate kinase [Candidatus Woesearchaeota archaeon]|nr:acetylglutamate kinase [Candidatus Woesearchaeota archaeon]